MSTFKLEVVYLFLILTAIWFGLCLFNNLKDFGYLIFQV